MQRTHRLSFPLAQAALAVLTLALVASPALASTTTPLEAAASGAGVVNINTADADQLMQLPRIGPSLAARIIDHRTRTPFKRTVELARVKGIGLKTVRKLKPWLAVAGPTTLREKLRVPKRGASEETGDARKAGGGPPEERG